MSTPSINHPQNAALPSPLRGIIPPMVTPLLDRDTLDVAALERLVEHILDGGVSGLFILGTTGEAPSLSYRLRHELIAHVCRQVNGRVPVLVGVTDSAYMETVRLAEKAAELGAQAVVLAPPYYFPAGQPELVEYIQHISAKLPLPIFLYNMPSHTKLVFEPESVRQMAEIKNIAGLKDSSGNMIYFHRLQAMLADHPNFSLLVGPEELLSETVLLGGHGGINGGANLFPRFYVELYRAAVSADRVRVAMLHGIVMRVSMTLYNVGRHSSSYLKGLKCALAVKGIIDCDFMAEPFHRFGTEQRKMIEVYLNEIEELMAQAGIEYRTGK